MAGLIFGHSSQMMTNPEHFSGHAHSTAGHSHSTSGHTQGHAHSSTGHTHSTLGDGLKLSKSPHAIGAGHAHSDSGPALLDTTSGQGPMALPRKSKLSLRRKKSQHPPAPPFVVPQCKF